jgi:hypothetical protein
MRACVLGLISICGEERDEEAGLLCPSGLITVCVWQSALTRSVGTAFESGKLSLILVGVGLPRAAAARVDCELAQDRARQEWAMSVSSAAGESPLREMWLLILLSRFGVSLPRSGEISSISKRGE